MTSVDFSTILVDALQQTGNDRYNISNETFGQFRDFINTRLRVAWEAYEWPEIMRLEELNLSAFDGDVTASLPTEAGYIINIYNNDPLKTTKARQVPYRLFDYGNGVVLNFPTDPDAVWCEYKLRKPELLGEEFDNYASYSYGAQVYFDLGASYTDPVGPHIRLASSNKPSSGNFWNCVEATSPGQTPLSHPNKWERVEIPFSFSPYLAKAAAADWLNSEMQIEASQVAEAMADRTLGNLIDNIARIQRQAGRINMIRTY